jgi:hypothetical protein
MLQIVTDHGWGGTSAPFVADTARYEHASLVRDSSDVKAVVLTALDLLRSEPGQPHRSAFAFLRSEVPEPGVGLN